MTDQPTIAAKTADDHPLSKGERWFDWLTYGGIAGVGVFLVTLPLTYWSKYAGGAKNFKAAAHWLEKKGFSAHTAEDLVMTTSLMQGGNLGLIPVKLMENNKPQIVKKINDVLGDSTDEKAVEAEPKQSWTSLLKARIIMAWTPVFLSFRAATMLLGKEKFQHFEHWFSESLICKPLGKATHIAGVETKAFRYGKIAALDAFATAAAATLLYIGSNIFAKQEKDEELAHTKLPETPKEVLPEAVPRKYTNTIKPCAPCALAKPKAASISEQLAEQRRGESSMMAV